MSDIRGEALLKEAIDLAKSGFSVIWLKNKSKAPFQKNWTEPKTATVDDLDRTYAPGRNMGVRLGEPSRVDGFYLHAIDMDIRDDDFLEEALKQLHSLLKVDDMGGFPTVISGSGGESRHFYFLAEYPYRTKKLWHTEEKIVDEDGKKHWCAEIELFGTGKQVALPPSVHPDTGEKYRWKNHFKGDTSRFPLLDTALLDDLTGEGDEDVVVSSVDALGISYAEAEEFLRNLPVDDWCEDREGWRNVGMALHHEFDGAPEAMDVWADFSKRSRKYDKRVLRDQWRSFKSDKDSVVTFASIIKAANDHVYEEDQRTILDQFDDLDDEDDDLPETKPKRAKSERQDDEDGAIEERSTPKLSKIPEHLMTVPGVLSHAVDHYNATSVQTQPQFAVQAALALGSVVLARHWMTDLDNYTSLYLVNLGSTGSGKEYGRKFLSKVLKDANLSALMGPNKYASEAGIMGELAWKPRHVTVYDEFGRLLESSGRSTNGNLRDAQTMLMSLFGTLDTEARPTSYSTNGKSKEQIDAMRSMVIQRPAITTLGLSVPESFFDAMSQDDVANGFLNRLIVVNSREPRRVEEPRRWRKPPRELLKWMIEYGNPDGDDDFVVEESAVEVDEPEIVEFTPTARKRLREIAQEVIDLQEKYHPRRLDGMFSRSKELTQRIALIVCLSRESARITEKHVDWAWDYVKFYTMEMVKNVQKLMGAGPAARIADFLAEIVYEAGEKGVTKREFARRSVEFKNLDERGVNEVIFRLSNAHDVVEVVTKPRTGRPSKAFKHADFIRSRDQ